MNISSVIDELLYGTTDVVDIERIKSLVSNYYENGTNYSVKMGVDPTAPDLHLGHTVLMKKLAQLQKHGAIVQLVIGDYTAQIGDPTGKSKTRKVLSSDDIVNNFKSYKEQFFKVIDSSKVELYYNSKWLDALGSRGLLKLAGMFNVARMLERDDFAKRYSEGISISISEFLYPLLQGYDSVYLKSDIEIGGNDQKFNLHAGRILQRQHKIKEQAIILLPILEGLDGVNKMSKSLDNYVGLDEVPNDMFAKLMSINDELMWKYYDLVSNYNKDEIDSIKSRVISGDLHPKSAKEELCINIVTIYHNKKAAIDSKDYFNSIHSKKEIPSDIITKELVYNEEAVFSNILVDIGLSKSTSQARRDILAGAVKVDGKKVVKNEFVFCLDKEYIVQIGKRKFVKLRVVK